jgi:hypothetical protein
MRPTWLVGPWLAAGLYPETLLTEVIEQSTRTSGSVEYEVGPLGGRLRVQVEGDPEKARHCLLELLTEATRRTIEHELSSQ